MKVTDEEKVKRNVGYAKLFMNLVYYHLAK